MLPVLHLALAAVPALLGLGAAAALVAGIARGRRELFARGLVLLLAAAATALPALLTGWPAWSAVEFTDGYSAVHAARHRTAGVAATGAALVAALVAWRARRRMAARGGLPRGLALACALVATAAALAGAWAVASGWQVRRPELRRDEPRANQLPVETGTPRVGGGPPAQD
ncbi:MAG: hypothetical protein MUF27_10450 [Acidobacteria bacterium]|jgi:hypothetical protein|nr:hypothetical protein [Acidobacteriota bacterium]